MLLNVIFFIIGFAISSFLLLNALLCIFFAIPFTKKLKKSGIIIDSESIISKCRITITLDLSILFLVHLTIMLFFTDYCISFYSSTIIVMLLSLRKLKPNESNISDYFNTYKDHIDSDSLSYLTENGLLLQNTNSDHIYEKMLDKIRSESNLSTEVSKICLDILIEGQFNKVSAKEKIYSTLIPQLKLEGQLFNVGIALGLLIDTVLTKDECINMSTDIIKQMTNFNDNIDNQ